MGVEETLPLQLLQVTGRCVTCVPTFEHSHDDPFGTVCIATCMCAVLA